MLYIQSQGALPYLLP